MTRRAPLFPLWLLPSLLLAACGTSLLPGGSTQAPNLDASATTQNSPASEAARDTADTGTRRYPSGG